MPVSSVQAIPYAHSLAQTNTHKWVWIV